MVKVSSTGPVTTTGLNILNATDASGARSTLGLGTAAVLNAGTVGSSIIQSSDASTSRSTLGLGTAATQASSAFEAAGAISTHAALTTTHGISSLGASIVAQTSPTNTGATMGMTLTNSNSKGGADTGIQIQTAWKSMRTIYYPNSNAGVIASGNTIRLRLKGEDAYNIAHAAIVERLSDYIGTTTPTPFTFSSSASTSGNSGSWFTSDWITYAFDKSKSYILIIDSGDLTHLGATSSSYPSGIEYRMYRFTNYTYSMADPSTPDFQWSDGSYMIYFEIQVLV